MSVRRCAGNSLHSRHYDASVLYYGINARFLLSKMWGKVRQPAVVVVARIPDPEGCTTRAACDRKRTSEIDANFTVPGNQLGHSCLAKLGKYFGGHGVHGSSS